MSNRRNLTKCLALATLISVGMPVVGDPCAYGIEYGRFKKICQDGIAKKTMPTVPVQITITGDTVTSNLNIVIGGRPGQKPHPITVLRTTQLGIESLRIFANELERRRVFWAPHLQAAEGVVAEALGKVQNPRLDAGQRLRAAEEARKKVTEIFQGAIKSYADSTGRKFKGLVSTAPSIRFNVKTNPSGLTVDLLLVGDYILLSELDPGASIDESPLWLSLPASEPAWAYGVYFYRFRRDGTIVPPTFSMERVKDITSQQDSILFE